MKKITNYIIEKLKLTKKSVLVNPQFIFKNWNTKSEYKQINIELPFILKIKNNARKIFDFKIDQLEIGGEKDKDLFFYHNGNKILKLSGYKHYIERLFINKNDLFAKVLPNNLSEFNPEEDKLVSIRFNDDQEKVLYESLEQKKYADMIVLNPDEDSILILKRSIHNGLFKRKYGFPGGTVDTNDKTTKDAAIRELKEETGIELTFTEQNKCKKYDNIINKDGSITEYFIVTLEEPRDIKLSNEHTSYKWYNGNIKVGFQWVPNVFQIIQKILD